MVRLAVVASIFSLLAGAASAQEAIPTAQGATPPDTSKEPPPAPLGARPVEALAPMQPGPCGTGPTPKMAPLDANGEPQVDTSPHGEMYAGVGTRGYREVGGTVCVPVGKSGAVTISVDQTKFDGRRR
jgi:hypothetical protein